MSAAKPHTKWRSSLRSRSNTLDISLGTANTNRFTRPCGISTTPPVYSRPMRNLLCFSLGVLASGIAGAAGFTSVTTLIGTGMPGYSDTQVNNPYGMTIGPDGALYFCEVDNQRVRKIDLKTRRMM